MRTKGNVDENLETLYQGLFYVSELGCAKEVRSEHALGLDHALAIEAPSHHRDINTPIVEYLWG